MPFADDDWQQAKATMGSAHHQPAVISKLGPEIY
jgi:hypothetical protein